MKLDKAFQNFLSNKVNLDESRIQRIQSAHKNVREFLSQDEEIKKLGYYETFLQGSYALHTCVKPKENEGYDVDIILALNLKKPNDLLPPSSSVINFVKERLKTHGTYKDKTSQKRKCVRIEYKGDGFHLDIVPSHCPQGDIEKPLLVPENWDKSHPTGFKKWCKEIAKGSKHFYSIVKLLKYWRNLRFGETGFPKSIVLTTIIGNHISSSENGIDTTLLETMKTINRYLQNHYYLPEIKNPSLESENLTKNWPQLNYQIFRETFDSATKKAEQALLEEDEQKTIEIWNSEILFKGNFPKKLYLKEKKEEAISVAQSLKNGKLEITTSGTLGIKSKDQVGNVPPTKFYGEKI